MRNKLTITLLATGLACAAFLCSCKEEAVESPTRGEYIKVYETSPEKLVDNIQIPPAGAQDGQIHVLSNVDLEWKHIKPADDEESWFTLKGVEEVEPGHFVVTYDAASLLSHSALDYRRTNISFINPAQSLGKFLAIRQGYDRKLSLSFNDEPGEMVTLTGIQTYTTRECPELNTDFFDYITFNAWAETDNEFLSHNITLDVTVFGGKFYDTDLTTYRINIPRGTGAEESNYMYLLVKGDGDRMSAKTTFTFSVANDDRVFVHVDDFAVYQVTEADILNLYDDEYFEEFDVPDWE